MNVLLVDPDRRLPTDLVDFLAGSGYRAERVARADAALAKTHSWDFDAIVLPHPSQQSGDYDDSFVDLMRAAEVYGMAAIVLGAPDSEAEAHSDLLVDLTKHASVTKEEIRGRLATILRYHRVVRGLERDLDNMQRLFKQLNIQFTEVDQEMRLAGRLQSDFLPRHLDQLGQARFAAVYRPATFVSGDIYDIFRADEDHVGFYVADAVGHGMAAGLLTMFIRNAIEYKRIYEDNTYELLTPGETLGILNDKLISQHLPNCQFVTAWCGMLNTKTMELQYARAGHPYPYLLNSSEKMTELRSPGGLLGLFEGEEFETRTIVLRPGDRIAVYSDGLEAAFNPSKDRDDNLFYFREIIREVLQETVSTMVERLSRRLDAEAGSLNPEDDVTCLVAEIEPPK